MRRISMHAAFALATTAALAGAGFYGLQWQQARQLNTTIAAAAQAPAPSSSAAEATVSRDAPREVRLAQATAWSQAGAFDAAFKHFAGLIEPGRSDAVSRHAQYNLGNMYVRQGLASGTPADTGPLLELAKQRYRDLLRADPQDWDARYNLERTLRAAPEEQETTAEAPNVPVERRNVALRGMTAGDLP